MRIKSFVSIAALVLAIDNGTAQAQNAPDNLGIPTDLREEVRDSFIFVFQDNVPANEVPARANALARANGGRVGHVYTTALKGFSAKMPEEAAARLAARNPNIAYYEPDAIAFAFKKPEWAGGDRDEETATCDPQVRPWGIDRVVGASSPSTAYIAWVIDTGIDLDHPDLNVDGGLSANFVARGKNSPDDGNGHGTHVAGTIAAVGNECDVIGVVPGAWVVAVRVLDNSGSGSYSGVIAGVDYVAANAEPGDVANMSLGGPRSVALNEAVENAAYGGLLFALAAGNSSADASNYSPGSAEDPNIFTVSAIDSNDDFAWFSNYGSPVDCAAPGVSILSTRRGGGTTTMSGTSMAAPHVAGLLLSGAVNDGGNANNDPDGPPGDMICHY